MSSQFRFVLSQRLKNFNGSTLINTVIQIYCHIRHMAMQNVAYLVNKQSTVFLAIFKRAHKGLADRQDRGLEMKLPGLLTVFVMRMSSTLANTTVIALLSSIDCMLA